MDKEHKWVPYMVYEDNQVMAERNFRRLWILNILLIILFVGSNALWLWHESQYDYFETSIEAEQDSEGINIIGTGDISYGAESYGNN